jgi:hypothetical protein
MKLEEDCIPKLPANSNLVTKNLPSGFAKKGCYMGCKILFHCSSMERDKFMSPKEALEFGLIDDILQHPPRPGEEESAKEPTDHTSIQG